MRPLLAVLLLPVLATFAQAESPVHPPVELLDAVGRPVVETGRPVSPMTTCGGCHNTEYIATHSYHASVGADERFAGGTETPGRPWNFSPGLFGRWDPMRYRRLTLPGEPAFDMGVADWIRLVATPLDGPVPRIHVDPS